MKSKQHAKLFRFVLRIILILISFTVTGCLRSYYPAVYETSPQPIIFEKQDSTKRTSHFINANMSASKGQYPHESTYLFTGSYLTVITRDYTNFNSRFYGYTGVYNVLGVDENYDGMKSIFGLGADLSASLNFKSGKIKFGIGSSLGLAGEFGSYYNFRNDASVDNLINGERQLIFSTLSVFPVVAMEVSDNSILTCQLNIGIPGYISPSLSLNNNGYIYWLSILGDRSDQHEGLVHRVVLGFMIDLNKF